jgi:hypothetical protein
MDVFQSQEVISLNPPNLPGKKTSIPSETFQSFSPRKRKPKGQKQL